MQGEGRGGAWGGDCAEGRCVQQKGESRARGGCLGSRAWAFLPFFLGSLPPSVLSHHSSFLPSLPAEHEEDDVSIWGDGLRRREHYPLWMLVGAVFFGLAALTQPMPQREAVALRLGQAGASAAMVAGYLALEFFPTMQLLQLVVLFSALVVALFLVLLALPLPSGPVLMPVLAVAWGGSFPAALVLAGSAPLPPLPADSERLYPESSLEVDVERREAVRWGWGGRWVCAVGWGGVGGHELRRRREAVRWGGGVGSVRWWGVGWG